jgi:fructose-bisphosphate aldolase class II
MLVNLDAVLKPAREQGYAIGAFNIYSLETANAVYRAALACHAPVIFAFGERYIDVANISVIASMVRTMAQDIDIPMVLHLDHCRDITVIYRAVAAGFTSVMFDGSSLDFDDNLAATRHVVEFAHSVGVTVEAELGSVPFNTADAQVAEEYLTKPDEASRFVHATGLDALAVAVGTAHGEYKGKPKIYHDRLREIARKVSVPLVLHGGSGIPDEDVIRAIASGIAKINVNTQISSVAVKSLKEITHREKPGALADIMKEVEDAMTSEVTGFIRLFLQNKTM